MAERLKCKPPEKVEVARVEPVIKKAPRSGSIDDSDLDSDSDSPVEVDSSRTRSPDIDSLEPISRRRRQPLLEEPVDVEALKDKYRPKSAKKPNEDDNTKLDSEPTGTILLEPIRPPTPPLEEIKVEPVTPTYVEVVKPLKGE